MAANSAGEGALESWLTAAAKVGACVGIGAFIDFYIGKPGQRRVKDWLETWWLKSGDVGWGALGREEALFAVQILNLLFGNRLFSARRMTVVSIFVFVGSLTIITVYKLDTLYDLQSLSLYIWVSYIFLFFLMALSMYITIIASATVVALLTKAPYLNIVGLIFIIVFQYSLILFWYPAMEVVRTFIIFDITEANFFGFLTHLPHAIKNMLSFIPELFKSFPFPSWPEPIVLFLDSGTSFSQTFFIAHLSDYLGTSITLLRVLIAIVFIISFFLQTLQRPIMTLWARVIESDKPVFTLLFAGIAGFAEIGQRIAKIF